MIDTKDSGASIAEGRFQAPEAGVGNEQMSEVTKKLYDANNRMGGCLFVRTGGGYVSGRPVEGDENYSLLFDAEAYMSVRGMNQQRDALVFVEGKGFRKISGDPELLRSAVRGLRESYRNKEGSFRWIGDVVPGFQTEGGRERFNLPNGVIARSPDGSSGYGNGQKAPDLSFDIPTEEEVSRLLKENVLCAEGLHAGKTGIKDPGVVVQNIIPKLDALLTPQNSQQVA